MNYNRNIIIGAVFSIVPNSGLNDFWVKIKTYYPSIQITKYPNTLSYHNHMHTCEKVEFSPKKNQYGSKEDLSSGNYRCEVCVKIKKKKKNSNSLLYIEAKNFCEVLELL